MKEFTIMMLSINKNNVDCTTELTIKADTANEAVIKSINWLTEKNLTIIDICYIDEKRD